MSHFFLAGTKTTFSLTLFTLVLSIFGSVCEQTQASVPFSFADIAEPALPGVVNIRTTTYLRRDRGLDLYQFFLGGRIPPMSTHSIGSGVIIDQEGHILTNNHVIAGASSVEILFAKSKQKVRARIVGIDPKTDLALLRMEGRRGDKDPQADQKYPKNSFPITELPLGDSDKLRVGDIVIAIGNPFGYSHTVTTGIISAKGRVIGSGPYDDFLQTDATIHPGNSGGPLLSLEGKVIGINTAVSSEGQGIGFAIPVNVAKNVIHDLIAYGKVRRPFLGVIGKDILSRDDLVDGSGGSSSDSVHGFLVTNLVVDSPAHKNGIKLGDLIMDFDDQAVMDLNHMQRLMIGKSPGDHARIKLYRRGRGFIVVSPVLGETPRADELPTEKDLF